MSEYQTTYTGMKIKSDKENENKCKGLLVVSRSLLNIHRLLALAPQSCSSYVCLTSIQHIAPLIEWISGDKGMF